MNVGGGTDQYHGADDPPFLSQPGSRKVIRRRWFWVQRGDNTGRKGKGVEVSGGIQNSRVRCCRRLGCRGAIESRLHHGPELSVEFLIILDLSVIGTCCFEIPLLFELVADFEKPFGAQLFFRGQTES